MNLVIFYILSVLLFGIAFLFVLVTKKTIRKEYGAVAMAVFTFFILVSCLNIGYSNGIYFASSYRLETKPIYSVEQLVGFKVLRKYSDDLTSDGKSFKKTCFVDLEDFLSPKKIQFRRVELQEVVWDKIREGQKIKGVE